VLNNNCQLQRAREGRFVSAKLSLPEKYGIRHMKLGDSDGTGKGEQRGEYKPERAARSLAADCVFLSLGMSSNIRAERHPLDLLILMFF
jgi:hypothetical protein